MKTQSLVRKLLGTVAVAAAFIGAPAFASEDLKPISRAEPEFPREAVQAGVNKGLVKAKMTIDGNGEVSRVEIVDASPRRVFDRAVVRALSQWKFSPGALGRTTEIEVAFGR